MATREGSKADAPPGSILLVVHDFIARSADELSLAKGDRIELIERDDDFGDGWFLGRHMNNGNTGLFPEGRQLRFSPEDATNVKAAFADSQQFTRHPRRRVPFQMPPSMAHAARPRTSRDQQQVPILRQTTSANLRHPPTRDKQAAPVR